jgi:3-isopropylmalate/(R)-2-methylmalate dehydratase large subunit
LGKNLFQKVWDDHVIRQLDNGQFQVFMALHLIHEVTSPQAFGMLKDKGLGVAYPKRTYATVDHIIPTDNQSRPLADDMAVNSLRQSRAHRALSMSWDRNLG